jgi:xanthine dehydrogenase YagR molybdenum-binding subunit
MPVKLGKGNMNTAKLLGGPAVEHYHQAIARRGRRNVRTGARRRGLIRVEYTREKGAST